MQRLHAWNSIKFAKLEIATNANKQLSNATIFPIILAVERQSGYVFGQSNKSCDKKLSETSTVEMALDWIWKLKNIFDFWISKAKQQLQHNSKTAFRMRRFHKPQSIELCAFGLIR